jgi:MFS family permease
VLGSFLGIGRFQRDARLFLGTSLVAGAALSLYWVNFNLYLAALGLSTATIGAVATGASLTGALVAFPASALSDRIGRRLVIAAGATISAIALIGLLVTGGALPAIFAFAALFAAGQQAIQVVVAPFLTEHSEPEHRNELFAVQFAIQSANNIVAAVLGGVLAVGLASAFGFDRGGPDTYRIILVFMAGLLLAGLGTVALLSDDRPARRIRTRLATAGEPAAFPAGSHRGQRRFGLVIEDRRRFVRLVLPGFLIAIGAGQVIPFLNLFIQRKFGLDLTSLNAVFALTSLGTLAAVLAQPRLAKRFGQITSVVIVQVASIPFLVVLGFSPILWTVIVAMAVRNSLMNAGNPIFSAFAMERVSPAERATLSAAMSVLWQAGWVIGGSWYALLQAALGFERGYTVNFITIITLYSTATTLYWLWFRRVDRRLLAARAAG